MPDPSRATSVHAGLPRWVKGLGVAVGLLVLAAIVMVLAGHGPGRHMSGADMPITGSGEPPG